ncbi:MAG: hypothetical protein ACREC6_04740, partial [Hyphomicrobiaceae bacterium]
MPKLPVKRPSGALRPAMAAAPQPVDPLAAEEQRKIDAFDLIKADAEHKVRLFEAVRALHDDPAWRTYASRFDASAEGIAAEAAKDIRNEDLRRRWLEQARNLNAQVRQDLLTRGTAQARREHTAELDRALGAHAAIFARAGNGSPAREQALADIHAALTVAQDFVAPDIAQSLLHKHMSEALHREAGTRVWHDPQAMIEDLQDRQDAAAPLSEAAADYRLWLSSRQIEDLNRQASRALSLVGRYDLDTAKEQAYRGIAPDPAVFERAAGILPAADVEHARRAVDAALALHRAALPLDGMDPAEAVAHIAGYPQAEPAWLAILSERMRDPVQALSG